MSARPSREGPWAHSREGPEVLDQGEVVPVQALFDPSVRVLVEALLLPPLQVCLEDVEVRLLRGPAEPVLDGPVLEQGLEPLPVEPGFGGHGWGFAPGD